MKRALGKILCGATLLLGLPLTFTSCEEILGEWSKPAPVPGTPNTPTPSPTPTPASKTAGAISYATASLAKGSQDPAFTNELTITGDGTVSYSSNNEAVATVDPNTGEVTPKGLGTVSITATVSDSETYTYETNTASYSLNVSDGYQYQKWDGSKFTTQYAATSDCQELADAASATWNGTKTYVAKGNVTISGDVTVSANSELILCDGATLTINGKLYDNGTGYALTIYAQSDGTKMGVLNASANMTKLADETIRFKDLTIHGGKITATTEGTTYTDCVSMLVTDALTMYGGDVTAQGNSRKGAGIYATTINIMNNVKLVAKGGNNSSEEGGKGIYKTSAATISVSGNAILTVTGGNSETTSGGDAVDMDLTASGNAKVTITGGNSNGNAYGGNGVLGSVTASGNASIEITAGNGAGGRDGISSKLTISDNASVKVKGGNATSNVTSAGNAIGSVDYQGGSFNATGGENSSNTTYNGKGIANSITNNSASAVDFEYGTDGSNWTTKQVAKTNTWSDANVQSRFVRTKQ
jgi:hypothetical protein